MLDSAGKRVAEQGQLQHSLLTVTYDCVGRISRLSTAHSELVARLKLESTLLDMCGDYVNTCLPCIISLLYRALAQRVTMIAAKPLPEEVVNFYLLPGL